MKTQTQSLLPNSYQCVQVQPNMVMEIPEEWNSFDDYLQAMKNKYRTRAKRAFKKFTDIEIRELDISFIEQNQENMYALLKNVADKAIFSVYELSQNYFLEMKRNLESSYRVFGCFLNDELVSFFAIIDNDSVMETGFLGYNPTYLHSHQLYLNMLYKMIEYAIDHAYQKIIFSRTALEIKSSVGAVPVNTFDFVTHTHPFYNKILEWSFPYFSPKDEWKQRHPFK